MARKEEAYNYLKEAIITNQLRPGEPISELSLSGQLNMRRSPIREALRMLEQEGLVVNYPVRGSFVAAMTPYDVEDVFQLRIMLELWALERSMTRFTPEDMDELERMFQDSEEEGSWEKRHEADRRFHAMIVEKAGSPRLLHFVKMLNLQSERIRRISAKNSMRMKRSYEEHMEILQHIRNQNLEAAKETLKKHLQAVANAAVEVASIDQNV